MFAIIVRRISMQGTLHMQIHHAKDVKIDIKCNTKLINEMSAEGNLKRFYQLNIP